MDIQKEREAFEAWLKSLNENGRTTYFLGQESTVAWEAWQAAKAQAVPEATCSIRAHELIIDETKKCLIDGYDIVEDEYLLESLVYRGVCIGKAQAVSEVITIGNELQSWVAAWSFSAKNDGEDYVVIDANLLAEKIKGLTGANA